MANITTTTITTTNVMDYSAANHIVTGALYKNLGLKLLHSSMQTSADYRSRRRHVSKQASLFAQLINKAIISMNNVQGQAARIAHKAQHC